MRRIHREPALECRAQVWAWCIVIALCTSAIVKSAVAEPVEFCNLDLPDDSDCYVCALNLVSLESADYAGRICYCPEGDFTTGVSCAAGTNDYGLIGQSSAVAPGDGLFVSGTGWVAASALSGMYVPPSGGGGDPGDDPTLEEILESLESETMASAFAAGFSVVGMGLLLGMGIRAILRMIR